MDKQDKQIEHIKDLMLLQPDNVTFGQFSVTPIQENILTLINEQLQGFMTNNTPISLDLFGQPYVQIKCDEAGGERNKAKVKKEAEQLAKKIFRFRWVHPKIHRTVETSGVIITSIHDYIGSNNIRLNFNPWAIPFLLYYGKGVGGTYYKKAVALNLRGDKAKRMYKIICSKYNEKNGYYDYSLDQLRKDFQLGPSYTNAIIRKRILEPAMEEIQKSGADVWFTFKMMTLHPKYNKRKPMADHVRLFIKTTRPGVTDSQELMNQTIHRWISIALDYDGYHVEKAFQAVVSSDRRDVIYNRFCYWDDQITLGQKTTTHVKNAIRKMLRDDFNIEP